MKDSKVRNDLILIAIVILFALISIFIINQYKRLSTADAYVVIEINGEESVRYPLSEDRIIDVDSYNGGRNTVIIKNGKVTVTEATCPDKICVKHKSIKYNGETIICLPNRMTVTIVNGNGGLDGKTY